MRFFFCVLWLLVSTKSFTQGTVPIEVGKIKLNLVLMDNPEGTGLFLGADYGAERNVTVGIAVGVLSRIGLDNYLFSSRLKIDYHFNSLLNLSKKWDVYVGGVTSIQFKTEGLNDHLYYFLDVGGRWYFLDRFGLNFEYGINPVNYYLDYLQFGVSYRL